MLEGKLQDFNRTHSNIQHIIKRVFLRFVFVQLFPIILKTPNVHSILRIFKKIFAEVLPFSLDTSCPSSISFVITLMFLNWYTTPFSINIY